MQRVWLASTSKTNPDCGFSTNNWHLKYSKTQSLISSFKPQSSTLFHQKRGRRFHCRCAIKGWLMMRLEYVLPINPSGSTQRGQLDWMLSTSEERVWKMIEEMIISSSSLRRCHQLRNSQTRNREINKQFSFCFYSSFLEFPAETRFCLTHSLHRLSRLERVLDISERLSEQNLTLEIIRDC